MQITLPKNFVPRPYQSELLQDQRRFKVAVFHRRGGKTKTVLNQQIIRTQLKYSKSLEKWLSPNDPRLTEAERTNVNVFYYFLPTYKQAKGVIWDQLVKEHVPMELVDKMNESELAIYYKNGSIQRFAGCDDIDKHRGINPIDVVLDEFSEESPELWTAILQPVLRENHGTATFIFCVTGDTLVLSQNGFKRIGNGEKKSGYRKTNDSLFGLNGFHKASDFYVGGMCPIIKITTSHGYEIKCTPEHKLWNGEKWILAKDIKINDNTVIQRNQQVFGEKIDFSDWNFKGSRKLKRNFVPIINEDLFYVLGLILAEGSWDKNTVTITNTDEEIIEFLEKFGFKRYDEVHLKYCSQAFSNFVTWFGIKSGAKNKDIPDKVLSLPKKFQSAFLSGYFDGDGSAGKNGRVTCTSSSEKLIRELQIILLNYGICSFKTCVITPPTKKSKVFSTGYRLEIGGYNARLFFDQIGFRLKRKQERQKFLKGKRNEYWNDVPVMDIDKVKDVLKNNKILAGRKSFKPTYHTMSKRFKINDDYFNKILEDNYYYDKIKKIEYGDDYVYDYVIPETHSFFSNGFVSHNTPKGHNHSWEIYEYGKQHPKQWFVSLKTVDDTNGLSKKEIEEAKMATPEALFQQEYYCSFLEDAGAFFRGIKECLYEADDDVNPKHFYNLGVDLAKYNDWTVLTPFDLYSFKAKKQERFNQVDWNFQKMLVEAKARKYNNAQLKIDRTGVGDPVVEDLVRVGLNIGDDGAIVFTSKTRRDMLDNLAILLQQKKIKIPNDPELVAELEAFQYSLNSKGKIEVKSRKGLHDDRVMSLALAVYGVENPIMNNADDFYDDDEIQNKNFDRFAII